MELRFSDEAFQPRTSKKGGQNSNSHCPSKQSGRALHNRHLAAQDWGGRQNSNNKQQKFAPGYLEHVSILQGTHQGDLNLYWLYPPWVGGGDY